MKCAECENPTRAHACEQCEGHLCGECCAKRFPPATQIIDLFEALKATLARPTPPEETP